jgi:hypothetical protein
MPPPRLYQYTDLRGFMGILESKVIWLSQMSTLNDYMEHNWLTKLAKSRLDRLIADPGDRRVGLGKLDAKDVPDAFLILLRTQLRHGEPVDPYCACFSEDGDVLSQWRAYADQGAGFAIGFDPFRFPEDEATTLKPVCYDPSEHARIVRALIEKYQERATTGARDGFDLMQLASRFHDELLGPSMTYKNPSFSEEKEWRVVHESRKADPPYQDGFRTRGSELLHYFKLPFVELPLREVVLGPRNPARTNQDALKTFLDRFGPPDVEIRESNATLR